MDAFPADMTIGQLTASSSNYTGQAVPVVNRPETIRGLAIALMAIAWLCVLARLYIRLRIVRALGWDDLFIMLAMATTTFGTDALLCGIDAGLGRHLSTLTIAEMKAYTHAFYVMGASYVTATAFIKLSLLLQYQRLYPRESSPRIHAACRGLLVFTALWGLAFGFLAWFPCLPPADFFDGRELVSPNSSRCYAYGSPDRHVFAAMYEAHSAVNMVLDLAVLAIAAPLFFRLGVEPRTRLALLALFSMGGLYAPFFPVTRTELSQSTLKD